MRKKVVFITGVSGEVGQGRGAVVGLRKYLGQNRTQALLTMDLQTLPADIRALVLEHIEGNLLDNIRLARSVTQYEIEASITWRPCSQKACEFTPDTAHKVNMEGTHILLRLEAEPSRVAQSGHSLHLPFLNCRLGQAPNRAKCATSFRKNFISGCGNGNGTNRAPCMAVINYIMKC